MFRSDVQQAETCQALVSRPGAPSGLWTPAGPTPAALRLLKTKGAGLSHGEKLMLLVSFDVWNGDGHADLGELLHTLDGHNLLKLGELLIALGSEHGSAAIDAWLSRWGPAWVDTRRHGDGQ